MSHEKTTDAVEEIVALFKKYDFDFYDMLGVLEVTKARVLHRAYKNIPNDDFDDLVGSEEKDVKK